MHRFALPLLPWVLLATALSPLGCTTETNTNADTISDVGTDPGQDTASDAGIFPDLDVETAPDIHPDTISDTVETADAGTDATEADTPESDTTESDTTESDTTESDTTESDTTEADTTEADTTEADTTEADTTEADTTETPVTLSFPLRVGQGVGVFLPRQCPTQTETLTTQVWQNHLDGVEVLVGGDWKVREWVMDPDLPLEERISNETRDLVLETRYWLNTLHHHDLEAFVSINWQGSLPGANQEEMEGDALQAYRFYKFNLETGERYEEKGFDWGSAAARGFALGVFTDVSTLMGPAVDWLFINEAKFQHQMAWHEAPVHSDAAIEDFHAFVGTNKGLPIDLADLPEGVTLAEPDLYNTIPTAEDWQEFEEWRIHIYQQKMQTLTEGFAAGQTANPNYQGAIWFQNYDLVDIESSLLDAVLSLEEIKYAVPENLQNPTAGNPNWDAWKFAAETHGKELGAFAHLSGIDVSQSAMTYIAKSTEEQLDQLLGKAVGLEGVSLMTMYFAGSFDPNPEVSSESYLPELIDVWDDWTHPDGPDANPTDWTLEDEGAGHTEEGTTSPENPQGTACPGDYIVNDGATALALANCASIGGDLTIFGEVTAMDMCALSGLLQIDGSLYIDQTTALTNLDGLAGLTSVGSTLRLYFNHELIDIRGLANVTSVGSKIYIGYNPKLTKLTGLEGVVDVSGIFIGANSSLKKIDSLNQVSETSYLKVSNNSALEAIEGLGHLTTLTDYLEVSGNGSLADLSGLGLLDSVGSTLKFLNNSSLCNSVIEALLEGITLDNEDGPEITGNDEDC